jgi:four helix bundle protein
MQYRDLLVWQKSMDAVVKVYELTQQFPAYEKFGLANQLQRAAVSVPANIAEGHGRKSTAVFINHISIAYGSLMEVETHIQIAERLGYVSQSTSISLLSELDELGRMLTGLKNSLAKRNADDINQ